jgi:hypothetical protein
VYVTRILLSAAIVVVCWLVSGCHNEPETRGRCPVSGKVVVNGHPAGGVYVQFHAADDPARAKLPDGCKSEADGTFSVPVREPGEYAVTVFWPTVTVVEGEQIEGADRFNGRHHNPQRPVLRITIQEGENTLPPIKLKLP